MSAEIPHKLSEDLEAQWPSDNESTLKEFKEKYSQLPDLIKAVISLLDVVALHNRNYAVFVWNRCGEEIEKLITDLMSRDGDLQIQERQKADEDTLEGQLDLVLKVLVGAIEEIESKIVIDILADTEVINQLVAEANAEFTKP